MRARATKKRAQFCFLFGCSFIKIFLKFTSNLDIEFLLWLYFFHLIWCSVSSGQINHAHCLKLLIYFESSMQTWAIEIIKCTYTYVDHICIYICIFLRWFIYHFVNKCVPIRNKMPHIITHNQLFILMRCSYEHTCAVSSIIKGVTWNHLTNTSKLNQVTHGTNEKERIYT